MKICSRCKKPREWSAFTKNKSRKDGLNSACRECHKEWRDNHYDKNREYYRAKAKRERKKVKQIITDAKKRPCTDCGIQYPPYVMDFDHLRDKKFNISGAAGRAGPVSILEELAKCEVVCANCHRERTHGSVQLL